MNTNNQTMRPPLPTLGEKIFYGCGAFGKEILYIMVMGFYLLYLYSEVKLPLSFITILFFSIRILDAFDDLITGWFIDKNKPHLGKFKAPLLIGGISSAIFAIAMFNVPDISLLGKCIYVLITHFSFTLSFSLYEIAFLSMIPSFSTESETREIMSAIPRAGAVIGSNLCLLLSLPFMHYIYNNLGFEDFHFCIYSLFISFIFLITTVVLIIGVKDRGLKSQSTLKIKQLPDLILGNNQLLVISGISFIQQLIIGIVNSTIIIFLLPKQNGISEFSTFLLVGLFGQILGFIVFKKSCSLLGRKRILIISCLLMALGYTGMFFSDPNSGQILNIFISSFLIASFGISWSLVLTLVMSADCVDFGEFKKSYRTEGLVYAVQNSAAKLGFTFAMLLSGATFNMSAVLFSGLQSQLHLYSIKLTLFIVLLLVVLLILLYTKSYRLHGTFFQNVLNSLEQFKTYDKEKQYATSLTKRPLRHALETEAVICKLEASNIQDALDKLCDRLVAVSAITSKHEFLNLLYKKIALAPCGIAEGIAIPHASGNCVKRVAIAMATLKKPLDFGAPDSQKCDLVFMIATPKDHYSHISILGQLSIILNIRGFAGKLRSSGSAKEIIDRILKCEKQLKD